MPSVIDRDRFYDDVYSIVREIPEGNVISYGGIARLMGWPTHSRMVGKAMSQVPPKLHLPCHRVVNNAGRLVPHWTEHRVRLEKEGVSFRPNGCVDMKKHVWKLE